MNHAFSGTELIEEGKLLDIELYAKDAALRQQENAAYLL